MELNIEWIFFEGHWYHFGTVNIPAVIEGCLSGTHCGLMKDMSPGSHAGIIASQDDDVIKWKHFPRYWPFVWGIHRSPVNSPHKDQWREALMFSLICTWINGWVNYGEAGDSRCHRAHYDVTVMYEKLDESQRLRKVPFWLFSFCSSLTSCNINEMTDILQKAHSSSFSSFSVSHVFLNCWFFTANLLSTDSKEW